MSERMMEAFREEAELLTAVPPFELIEQRGRARRRRRQAVVGVVAACALAVTGLLAETGRDHGDPRPAADPTSPLDKVMFMGVEAPATVTFDRPADWAWTGWGAVSRVRHERNVARFGAVVVERVAKDPCQVSRGAPDYRTAASEPAQLAAQLAAMAHVRVVQEPVPDDRFGLPALHLRLQGTGPACTAEEGFLNPFMAYQDDADGGRWPDPFGVADLWVVDVGDRVVLVEAVTGRQVSPDDRDTLAGVVESVEITPTTPD